MDFYYKILVGVLIGLAVGAVNFYLLRVFVRVALKNSGRLRGVFIIILSYALRYLFIAAVVFWLMKNNEQILALTVLAVLGAMTMLLAALQQRKKAESDR
jgi:K+-sensing histidine kinase KdpD